MASRTDLRAAQRHQQREVLVVEFERCLQDKTERMCRIVKAAKAWRHDRSAEAVVVLEDAIDSDDWEHWRETHGER